MPRKQGTPAAVAARKQAESYEIQLPAASITLMQAANAKIVAAQNELAALVAAMLSAVVTDGGTPTNVNVDTGVVTLTRGAVLTEVNQED